MLNAGSPIVIGIPDRADEQRNTNLIRLLDGAPGGTTPLCKQINAVVDQIQAQEQQLRDQGKKALLVIATDGESSDGDVTKAMRPLKNLPVWVIVRFCTDQDNVVSYWNRVDQELELNMDVVDDLCGEAKEISKFNPWLTYGEPLQRLREFGLSVKELDLMDERRLSLEELRRVCTYIYGGSVDTFPHPEADWNGFIAAVEHANTTVAKTWNPISQQPREWISVPALKATYQ
eukprot:gene28939-35894_t